MIFEHLIHAKSLMRKNFYPVQAAHLMGFHVRRKRTQIMIIFKDGGEN